jgi:hypothetical protein
VPTTHVVVVLRKPTVVGKAKAKAGDQATYLSKAFDISCQKKQLQSCIHCGTPHPTSKQQQTQTPQESTPH